MTILLTFQLSDFRHFKGFYKNLETNFSSEFPNLVSYSRFVTLMKSCMVPMVGFFEFVNGIETDSYFIDATAIAVSKNKRIYSHKVFKNLAKRGKSSMSWAPPANFLDLSFTLSAINKEHQLIFALHLETKMTELQREKL